jgi:NTE family protein
MSLAVPSEDTARLRLQKVLQQTPLFADLAPDALAAVEHQLTLLVLPGGAPLFRQGEPADAVYVVTSGSLGVFRHHEAGDAREAWRHCATARSGGCPRPASTPSPRTIPRSCPR